MKLFRLKSFFARRSLSGIAAVLILWGGCGRVYQEYVAWDSSEAIFFDAKEPDPKVGFRLLRRRWESFKPLLLPDTGNMREARTHAGACLVVAFWDQLSDSDRKMIIAEAKVKDYVSAVTGDDYNQERKNLTLIKAQIMEKGFKSLAPDQRKLWDQLSANFGDRSK